jgi:general secretion pathway protein A
MDTLRHHFGFRHDPFPQNVPVKDLYPLPALEPLRQRVFFALDQKAIAVITGDVGSGKSTSLRYVSSKCHSSEYELITIVGGNFSPMELYRQILLNFGMSYLSIPGIDHDLKDQGTYSRNCISQCHPGTGNR